MDIFKFIGDTSPYQQGVIINNLKSKMWVERYREAGEFTLVAKTNSGIRDILPIGTLISHVDSTEVMIVENHEIRDQRGQEPEITITGRGLETFLENRMIGSNQAFPVSTGVKDYTLAADDSWDQAVTLIKDHIYASFLINDDYALPYITVSTDIVGSGTSIARSLKQGALYPQLLELLAVDNLGIKVLRPEPFLTWTNVRLVVHRGSDRSSSVVFSYDTGELESAEYLWSNKTSKNCALVVGKWVQTVVDTGATGFDCRMMYVDASDIDNSYTAAPTGATLTAIEASMQQRGAQALASQNDVALTKAELSRDSLKAQYRVDYNVGDIVSVQGDFNESTSLRIEEYVEIEDETGSKSYPTLASV